MKKEEMTARIEAFHKLPDWAVTEDEIDLKELYK